MSMHMCVHVFVQIFIFNYLGCIYIGMDARSYVTLSLAF